MLNKFTTKAFISQSKKIPAQLTSLSIPASPSTFRAASLSLCAVSRHVIDVVDGATLAAEIDIHMCKSVLWPEGEKKFREHVARENVKEGERERERICGCNSPHFSRVQAHVVEQREQS